VGFFAMVHATEDLVGEVYADLFWRCVSGDNDEEAVIDGRLRSVELVCFRRW
jgi:hypothetical protein